jgi:predicted hydrocarbon binding protein
MVQSSVPEKPMVRSEGNRNAKEFLSMSYRDYLKDIHEIPYNLFAQMEQEMGREKALAILRRAGERYGRKVGEGHVARLGKIDNFQDFKALWHKVISTPLWEGTQDSEIVEEGTDHLSMRVTRCLWAETFKKLGDVEAGYLMCCNCDHEMVRAYNPRLRISRTRTIMQGDDHCNHIFIWE